MDFLKQFWNDATNDAYIAIKTKVEQGLYIIHMPAYSGTTIRRNAKKAAVKANEYGEYDDNSHPEAPAEASPFYDDAAENMLYTAQTLEKITRRLTPKQKTLLVNYYEEKKHKSQFDKAWRYLRDRFKTKREDRWTERQFQENEALYQKALQLLDRLTGYLQNPGPGARAKPGALKKEQDAVSEKTTTVQAEQAVAHAHRNGRANGQPNSQASISGDAREIRVDWWFFARLKQEKFKCSTINAARVQYNKAIAKARKIANR